MSFNMFDKDVGYLPKIPKPYQVVTVPEDIDAGSAVYINIYNLTGKHLGVAQTLKRMPNTCDCWQLLRVDTSALLCEGDRYCIAALEYRFTSVVFVEYFGWVGHDKESTPKQLIELTAKLIYANHECVVSSEDIVSYDVLCLRTS